MTRPAGDILREYRLHRGMTQVDLARRSKVCLRTIHALESGTSRGRMEVRKKVLVALGVNPWQQHHRRIFGPLQGES